MGSTKPDKTELTPREQQIQQMLARGMTRKQIAVELGIAYRTVGRHLDSIRYRVTRAKSNDCSRSAQVEQ